MAVDMPETGQAAEQVPETMPAGGKGRRVRGWVLRIAKWLGLALAAAVLLVLGAALGLNTQAGRRLVADMVSGYHTQSGLNFRIGRIDGDMYGAMVLRDVTARDPQGSFASAGEIRVDWRPFRLFSNHVDLKSLTSPSIRLARLPRLKETAHKADQSILPDIDIDVNRLSIDRIDIARGIAGDRRVARLAGSAHLRGGRAQLALDAATLPVAGDGAGATNGGDRLRLRLDAVPDRNRLVLDGRLDAPKGGLVTTLLHLESPLRLALGGGGDWRAWNGRATGRLGNAAFLALDLSARSGRFGARGTVHPALLLTEGAGTRLLEPGVEVTATVARNAEDDGRLDLDIAARSRALSATARGGVRTDHSRFDTLRVDALLLRPSAVAPNMAGQSIRARLTFDGPFARPTIDYGVTADRLAFGETVLNGLRATGQARVEDGRILIPVDARMRGLSGVHPAAAELGGQLTVRGDMAFVDGKLFADALRVRSDKVDGRAAIMLDTRRGYYAGSLNGRVDGFRLDGVAIADVTTDGELTAGADGHWTMRARLGGRTSRILNEGALSLFGGNATAAMRMEYGSAGVFRFDRLRLNAPRFRILSGMGSFTANGPLQARADAWSADYGPLSARLSGNVARPELVLRAARPGAGVGLRDLVARVRGDRGAFAVDAAGDTDYGPFRADLGIDTRAAMRVDIRSGRFAGMNLGGQLVRTGAGPFEGNMTFAGSGVNGRAQLSAMGDVQHAVVRARAADAAIPGSAGLTIGRAMLDADIALEEHPRINADVQIANLHMGDTTIAAARARIAYRGRNGTAQFVARGASGVPFNIAANARLMPEQWLVALSGASNGIDFRTDAPARIAVSDGRYRLAPVRITLDGGAMRVGGEMGGGAMVLQARLEQLDLTVLNAFVPDLGIGGRASGSIDFSQSASGAFPRAESRLEITGFTRTGIAGASTPVNVTFSGRLLPDGGDARALVKRGGTTIGRMVATLRPLGPEAGSWTERLMAAPLSGGVRYNGPSSVLFSLAGQAGQRLSGPAVVAADFSGHVRAPRLVGIVRANALTYENELYGTRLTQMAVDGSFTQDRLVLNRLTARAGDGNVTASGEIGLSAEQGFPMRVRADLSNARLARSNALSAAANGSVEFTNSAQGALLSGRLRIPEARYRVIRQGAAEVAELQGVRRRGDGSAPAVASLDQAEQPRHVIRLNLNISADNRLFLNGMGLDSEWAANITIRGTSAAPRVTGNATVVSGTYSFAGREFELERTSRIDFEGNALLNPSLGISATTTAQGVTAIINIEGTAQRPDIRFTSTPTLPQDEILSRLLFGSSVTNLSATEAVQLAAALNSLRAAGGLNPLGQLRSAAGIDRLRVLAADETSGRGTALAAGQYLTDDIYVEIVTDARGFTATQLEIALSRALSVLSQTGSFGGSSVSLRYSRDY